MTKTTRFNELKRVFERLHGPKGCMWDKKQTHGSLVQYLREESDEFIDALERGDSSHMKEELGDILLQVMFHAQIASRAGKFDIEDVIGGLIKKLKRRHPHVFGRTRVGSVDDIIANWHKIKAAEKRRRPRRALALILAMLLAGTVFASEISPPRKHLPEHEKLVFDVKWLGIGIGTVTATINGIKKVGGRDAYEIEVTVKTNDFASTIYPVNDRYVSYMDAEKLWTLRHEVYRREGRFKKDAVTDFDQAGHKAYFRNLLDGSQKTVDIPAGVQDSVSAAYYFRMVPVVIGRQIGFSMYNSEDIYELSGVADRKENIMLPGIGAYEAFHIQPFARVHGDIFRKGRASGYFSCDESRTPLLMSIQAPLFTEITGYLAEKE